MTSPSSSIKLQKLESELSIQFQIDDLQANFSRSSSSRYTEYFGPGLRFGSHSFVDTNGPSHIGLYLYTSKKYAAMSVSWSVTVRSLAGQSYLTRSMSYSFKSGEAIGWSKVLTSEAYHNNATMKAENAMAIHATLKFAPMWPIVFKPTLDVLHRTVLGKSPPNIRSIAYERRNSNGRLSSPRTLFATNDAMIQRSDLFGKLHEVYEGGIAALSSSILKENERPKTSTFTTYRDDDSDFEDDPQETGAEDTEMSAQLDPRASSVHNPSTSRSHSEFVVVKSEPISQASTLVADDQPDFAGRTVVLHGVAATTWEAVLYWLYTGVIVFAPLTSIGDEQRSTFIEQYHTANPDSPTPVSCKSIYRVADALHLDGLKKRALDHLVSQLSMQTYLHELFSKFTSRYDEVRKLEMLAVVKHWDDIKGSAALKEKMVDVVSGKLPHAGQILADLLLRASIKEDINKPAT